MAVAHRLTSTMVDLETDLELVCVHSFRDMSALYTDDMRIVILDDVCVCDEPCDTGVARGSKCPVRWVDPVRNISGYACRECRKHYVRS